MKQAPIIVLLTDFGLTDHYVASMKGVILSIAPQARIIDLSHQIFPQNINQAAFLLWNAYSYFPKHSIFVCIIDPGVGTSRKILFVEANGYKFIVPDNGLLKFILSEVKTTTVISVTNKQYFLKKVSSTFHGRDIFASVAAHIARGISPRELGLNIKSRFVTEEFIKIINVKGKRYLGKVLHIDHYGNLVTNFSCKKIPRGSKLNVGRKRISSQSRTYKSGIDRQPFIILGSSNLIEISLRNGSAAKLLHASVNKQISIQVN